MTTQSSGRADDVWVVWSDYGLNGAEVHAVLTDNPDDDEVRLLWKRWNAGGGGAGTGYNGTMVTRMRVGQWRPAGPVSDIERLIRIDDVDSE